MTIAPLTNAEIEQMTATLLAAGGPFATMPMTIGDVAYDRVFALSNASLRDLMAMRGAEYADLEFMVYEGERWTFGQTWARSMRLAQWMVKEHGIKPGDRVAIAMRNYPEWAVAFIAIVAAGATAVPLNAWWQGEELHDGISRSGSKLVFCDQKRAGHIASFRDELDLVLVGGREPVPEADAHLNDIMDNEAIAPDVPQVPIDPDSDFCMLFTSGSTGKPKGVMLTHRGVINALLSWSFLLNMAQGLRPDHAFVPKDPAVLLALPLFHVTALHSTLLLSWFSGRKTVFAYRWDAQSAIDLIKEEKITNFVGVPTMAHELVQHAQPGDLDTVVDITTGGAKRPENQVADQAEKFPGVAPSAGYGLTETNSMVAYIGQTDFVQNPSSAGRAVPPVTQIEALDEDGKVLPRGTEGEICIRSPLNFRAYLDDPEATAAAFHPDGWFRSGDVGIVNQEGYIVIMDRAKNIIIRGGENIGCLEVEDALHSFPGVDEASVFAVPDELLGERVGAAIYSREGAVDLQALRDHVAGKLAGFKVPERLWISPQALPRGGTGKVDKRQIRQVALTVPPHWSA